MTDVPGGLRVLILRSKGDQEGARSRAWPDLLSIFVCGCIGICLRAASLRALRVGATQPGARAYAAGARYGISPRRCSDSVTVFGANISFSTGAE